MSADEDIDEEHCSCIGAFMSPPSIIYAYYENPTPVSGEDFEPFGHRTKFIVVESINLPGCLVISHDI